MSRAVRSSNACFHRTKRIFSPNRTASRSKTADGSIRNASRNISRSMATRRSPKRCMKCSRRMSLRSSRIPDCAAEAAGDSRWGPNGRSRHSSKPTKRSWSAMRTKETPARLWTVQFWRTIRILFWKRWRLRLTRSAHSPAISMYARSIRRRWNVSRSQSRRRTSMGFWVKISLARD